MSGGTPADQPIYVPTVCHAHQLQIVDELQIGPEGPWQTTIIIVNILLFQAATENPVVWDRCGKLENGKADEGDLSLVLAEIGCLGCFQPDKLEAAIRLVERKGLSEVARITRIPPPQLTEEERV